MFIIYVQNILCKDLSPLTLRGISKIYDLNNMKIVAYFDQIEF